VQGTHKDRHSSARPVILSHPVCVNQIALTTAPKVTQDDIIILLKCEEMKMSLESIVTDR
jgi:hypothetical protein